MGARPDRVGDTKWEKDFTSGEADRIICAARSAVPLGPDRVRMTVKQCGQSMTMHQRESWPAGHSAAYEMGCGSY